MFICTHTDKFILKCVTTQKSPSATETLKKVSNDFQAKVLSQNHFESFMKVAVIFPFFFSQKIPISQVSTPSESPQQSQLMTIA